MTQSPVHFDDDSTLLKSWQQPYYNAFKKAQPDLINISFAALCLKQHGDEHNTADLDMVFKARLSPLDVFSLYPVMRWKGHVAASKSGDVAFDKLWLTNHNDPHKRYEGGYLILWISLEGSADRDPLLYDSKDNIWSSANRSQGPKAV